MARHASPTAFGLVLCSLAVLGCTAPPQPVVTRDSAGVAVTLSNLPAWDVDDAWRVNTAEPRLVVGGLVGQRPYEFTTVGDARLLNGGQLLVTHCSNPPELRLYGADGGFIRHLGGQGSGPGQCNFILHSWMAADTAILYDPSLARITSFPLAGGPPTVLDLDAAGLGDVEESAPLWISRFGDGTLLGRPNRPDPVVNGRSRAPFHYVRLDPGTMTVDTLARARGTEHIVDGLGTPSEDSRSVLFSPFTHGLAHGDRLYLADSESFWIDVRDVNGALVRRFGRAWQPVTIDRRFRRVYQEQQLDAAPTSRRAAVRREMARAVFADHFPAHEGDLVLDPAGNLWVVHLRVPGEDDRAWSVFDPEGRWLGEVRVPAALRVTDIGDDYILGVWQDPDGVQTIRRFDLVKPGA
jgi:hypothetical protein